MEPEGSLPHSQVPVTCPYPEPCLSSSYPTYNFLKIYLNIILPSTPGSSKWCLFLRFPHQNPEYASLIHTRYMLRPLHSSRYDHWNDNGWGLRIIKLLIVYFSPLPCYLVPFTTNILNTLFSNNLSLRSFLNVNDQVSHSYKTTCRYSYIYTLYK